MTAAVSDSLRTQNAQLLLSDFSANAYYMLMGNQLPYSTATGNINYPYQSGSISDTAVPQATTYTAEVYDLWRMAYGAKQIPASNIALCIPYIAWTQGTVYSQYDAYDTNLDQRAFYVLNTNNNSVYKCLSNNGNSITSTTPPASVSSAAFTTPDGYRWKYMYTITSAQSTQFVSTSFMPVYNVAGNNIAAGSIESFRVTNGGLGYTGSTAAATVTGDGTGCTAIAYISGGVVTHIEVTNGGAGYTYATVSIASPGSGGTQATALPNLAPAGGHGYDNLSELFARYATVAIQFNSNEGGNFSVATSFRQIAVVKAPLVFGGSGQGSSSSYNQSYQLSFSSTAGTFSIGELVTTNGGASAYVVQFSGGILWLNNLKGTLNTGNIVTGATSGATGTISAVTNPGLQPFSGKIVYFEDRAPVSRALNQIENIYVTFEY